MNYIPIGLHLSVPEGLIRANLKTKSFPFDWLYSPSDTTFNILNTLITDGSSNALHYMKTGYTYFDYLGKETYVSVEGDYKTQNQMNKTTGLGNSYLPFDIEYETTLQNLLQELLDIIHSNEDITFIYSDCESPDSNYLLDGIDYGVDATEYLSKIHELIHPINNNIHILYFCWKERVGTNPNILYIPFEHKVQWGDVAESIKDYFIPPPPVIEETPVDASGNTTQPVDVSGNTTE
jgi:hypothetical protein